MPVHEQSAFSYLQMNRVPSPLSITHCLPPLRDSTVLIISSVVNSGGRIWPIQLAAWQLLWLSRVTLAKTYFCQFTKKIWRGEGVHMVTFSNWLLKNVLRIFGKMPALKTELKVRTENALYLRHCISLQVLQVNLSMMLSEKCLWDKKKEVRLAIQNMPAESLQFLAIQREVQGCVGKHSKKYEWMTIT